MEAYFGNDVAETTNDIVYVAGSTNPRQRLDLVMPRGVIGAPIVVFIHGGFWIHQDKNYFQPFVGLYHNVGIALARRGIGTAIIDYRLAPEVMFEQQLDDVAAAIHWVWDYAPEYCGDSNRIVVAGHSAGGHIAALLAFDPQRLAARGVDTTAIKGYAPLSPILDLEQMAASSSEDAGNRGRGVRRGSPRVFTDDLSQSERRTDADRARAKRYRLPARASPAGDRNARSDGSARDVRERARQDPRRHRRRLRYRCRWRHSAARTVRARYGAMNRRVLVVVALLAIAVGVALVLWRQHEKVEIVRGDQASGSAGSATGSSATIGSASTRTGDHVTQVGRAERDKLAQRIAAANAARSSSHSVPARPALPDQGSDDPLARVQDHVMTALKEAIPFLAQCYEKSTPFDARTGITTMAMMTLTTDPDIGTVIDADQIFDDKNQPIPKALDDCLRNTMQTLALPPLDSEDTIKIQYSFRFE